MKISLRSMATVASIFFASLTLDASTEKTIELTASNCQVSVSVVGGDDCNTNQCSGDSTCICASKGEHIKWTLSGDDKFKLKFSGDSPLKDNCGKNYKKAKHKCVIKSSLSSGESFSYDIKLESCANGTDPKIIIK